MPLLRDEEPGIPLATRQRTSIPNVRKRPRAPQSMQAARELWTRKFPGIVVRSLDSTYNCVGMALASRRAAVEPTHIATFLRDDGYTQVPAHQLALGDLVIYRPAEGAEPTHIGIVWSVRPDLERAAWEVTALSQWGFDGEYLHRVEQVPEVYGRVIEFWTERR